MKKAIYIEPAKELDEEVRFILDTRNLSKQLVLRGDDIAQHHLEEVALNGF